MRTALVTGVLLPKGSSPASLVIQRGEIEALLEGRADPNAFDRVFDFGGAAYVSASYTDAHQHAASWGLSLSRPNLSGAKSVEEALEIAASALTEGRALICTDYDQSAWRDPRHPTRDELDALSGETPVVFRRICGHAAVLNGAALRVVGPDAAGVDYETGLALETVPLAISRYFPPGRDETEAGILRAQVRLNELGVTTIHEIGRPVHLFGYNRLAEEGRLTLRVRFCLLHDYTDHLEGAGIGGGYGSDTLKLSGIKLFGDGSVGARNASFYGDFTDAPAVDPLFTAKEVGALAKRCEGLGFPLWAHAIGTRAIHTVLEGLQEGMTPGNPLRHRIEHFEFPDERAVEQAVRLNVGLSLQPNFTALWAGEGGLYMKALGRERASLCNPFRTLLDAGLAVGFGSDAMPPDVQLGLRGASECGAESRRIKREEAERAYTETPPLLASDRGKYGKVEPGYTADLKVTDRPPHEKGAKVLAAFLAGEKVWPA